MKKLSWLLFVLPFLGLTFSACSDDDDVSEQEVPGEVYVEDELGVLQHALVKVDKDGKLVERVLGVSLDAADPDEVSVGVENYEEAVDIFTGLFADTTMVSQNGTLATFTTREGKAELVRSDVNGTVACAKFNVPGLKHVSQVNFILNSAWPDNDDGRGYHKFGVIYEAKGWTGGGVPRDNKYINPNESFKYLCIREYGNGKPALLFAICPTKFAIHPWSLPTAGGNMPNESKAREIAGILQKDWDFYKKRMNDAYGTQVMGEGDSYCCWINKATVYGLWVNQYYIHLHDGYMDWNDTAYTGRRKRYTLFYMESGQRM